MARPPLAALLLIAALVGPVAAEAEELWIHWTRPSADAQEIGPLALLEIEGWAVAGPDRARDVVVAIDVSASTLLPSGGDIDGDGVRGRRLRSADDPLRTANPRRLCSDPGDTIRAAELSALRHFADALAGGPSRIAVLTFAERAELRVPLSSDPTRWREGIDRIAAQAGFGGNATDLGAVLDESLAVLADSPPDRDRWIVLLSDGLPETREGMARASDHALRAAHEAAARGVRIHALALGSVPMGALELYDRIAAVSDGHFESLATPADVVRHLVALDLSRVATLQVENRSTGVMGRAVRVSPDGRFDGVVALSPGENRIHVEATSVTGESTTAERRVVYDPRDPLGQDEILDAARKKSWLLDRTTLLELELEAYRRRSAGVDAQVQVAAEPPVDVAAPPPGGVHR